MRLSVSLLGRDELILDYDVLNSQIVHVRLQAVGCPELLALVSEWRPKLCGDILRVPRPLKNGHASLLLRKIILQLQNKWREPYQAEELCHCRAVPTAVVDNAILAGCHTPEAVSAQTSASTSCGTCRPDVENQLEYFLKLSRNA